MALHYSPPAGAHTTLRPPPARYCFQSALKKEDGARWETYRTVLVMTGPNSPSPRNPRTSTVHYSEREVPLGDKAQQVSRPVSKHGTVRRLETTYGQQPCGPRPSFTFI